MLIRNSAFGGENPKLGERLLPESVAAYARDCELVSGELRALHAPLRVGVSAIADAETLLEIDGERFVFAGDVDAMGRTLLAGAERVLYSGEGAPRTATVAELRAGVSFRLGVPTPQSAPGVLVIDAGEGDDTPVDIFYVATLVNRYGEEGHRSAPSAITTARIGAALGVAFDARFTPGLVEYGVERVRVYRSIGGGLPKLVFDEALREGGNTFTDHTDEAGAETLPSEEFYPPPVNMIGLHAMSNGVYLGFVPGTRRVLVSEPYQPSAWPYAFDVQSEIVAVASYGSTAVALTRGHPEIASIVDPRSIVPVRLPHREPCVAKRGVAVGEGGVFYPCPSGLGFIGAGGFRMLTENLLDARDWQTLAPATFTACVRDGQYIAFHDGPDAGGWVFDLREERAIVRRLSQRASAVHVREGTDELLMVDGTAIEQFGAGAERLTYLWRSKTHGGGSPFALTARRLLSPDFTANPVGAALRVAKAAIARAVDERLQRLTAAAATGSGGALGAASFASLTFAGSRIGRAVKARAAEAVTLRLYGDERLVHEEEIVSNEEGRLRYSDRRRLWRYELEGTATLTQIDLAGAISDMHTGS